MTEARQYWVPADLMSSEDVGGGRCGGDGGDRGSVGGDDDGAGSENGGYHYKPKTPQSYCQLRA